MVLFNYSTKELTAKIVYYGPGLCGKTTNLQYIHGNLPGNVKGKMLSLATKTDRTLFFDFLPIDLGEIRGMKTRVQLYTVPGQVFYNETRKLVLKGADGIVFVADSQEQMLSANVESFKNLEENLKGHGLLLNETPHVIQFNKRDLPKLASIEQLNSALNKYNAPFYESVATTGIGVQDTLKAITKLVLLHLTKKYDPRSAAAQSRPAAAPAPAPAAPVAAAPPPRSPVVPGPGETQAIPLASLQPERPQPISISTPSPLAAAEPAPAFDAPPSAAGEAQFDDSEIEDLVGEVEEIEDVPVPPNPFTVDESALALETPTLESRAAEPEEPPAAVEIEIEDEPQVEEYGSIEMPAADDEPSIDLSFGQEADEAPQETAFEPASFDEPAVAAAEPAEAAEPVEAGGEAEVLLTEAADDDALFDDPNLEIARFEPGMEREILVPVELGADGETKRYRLSIRLRFDDSRG